MVSEVILSPEVVASDLRPVLLRLARELRKETEQLDSRGARRRSSGSSSATQGCRSPSSRPRKESRHLRCPATSTGSSEPGSSSAFARPDRRQVGLELTDEGAKLLRRVRARRTGWLDDALARARLRGSRNARGRTPGAATSPSGTTLTTLVLTLKARTFRSLRRHRNYRIFFTGQLVSLAGTWMQNVALAWLVLELSGSALAVGALAFWRFVPFTVFGLVAGVVADRFDSRRLVMGTQAAAMVVSIALAAVTLTGTATLPVVFALAALGGITLAFDAPGRQSLTFQLVGRRSFRTRSRSTPGSSTARASSAPRSRA